MGESILPDITNFSSGYWLVEGFEVEPTDAVNSPVIQEHLYGYLQDEYYGDYTTPIVFRHGETKSYFRVEPTDAVNIGRMKMPIARFSDMQLEPTPETVDFLLAKPKHAQVIAVVDTVAGPTEY